MQVIAERDKQIKQLHDLSEKSEKSKQKFIFRK